MSAVDIFKYFIAKISKVMGGLTVHIAFAALAAVGNVLLLPTNLVGWLEGKGERLWLRWHSPQLSGHMENLRRIEHTERMAIMDEEGFHRVWRMLGVNPTTQREERGEKETGTLDKSQV